MSASIHHLRRFALAAFCGFFLFAGNCLAASSDWLETSGGRVRLLVAGPPGSDGAMHGALEIDLKPGWKTYWRDPGTAGVPPELDISDSDNIASVELSFPAPEPFNDGAIRWAGYKRSVSFPVRFTLKEPGKPSFINAMVFLGMCETICIPVQGRLLVDPARPPIDGIDSVAVQMAKAALPPAASPGFGLSRPRLEPDRLIVEATLPGEARQAELFIAGAHGFMFGTPESRETNGKILFTLPLVEQPAKIPGKTIFHYTLTTDAGAVNGTLQIP